MEAATNRLSRTLWVGVGLVIVTLCLSFVLSGIKPRQRGNHDLPVIGAVADFTLTNQAGRQVTLADLRGKVWVADIIFTSCAGPCPRMTKQMQSLQGALPKESRVQLVSLTTDPGHDTPEVLQKYARHFDADPDRWSFLTGSKSQIAALAIDSLKLTAIEKKPEERTDDADLFIHSTIFVLVDKQARLRAAFETEGEAVDWNKKRGDVLSAINQLEREK